MKRFIWLFSPRLNNCVYTFWHSLLAMLKQLLYFLTKVMLSGKHTGAALLVSMLPIWVWSCHQKKERFIDREYWISVTKLIFIVKPTRWRKSVGEHDCMENTARYYIKTTHNPLNTPSKILYKYSWNEFLMYGWSHFNLNALS